MAQGVQQPRALVLSTDDRVVVIKRLARAVLKFQDNFLEQPGSPAGLLCQVWLPEVTGEHEVVLKTKGMPFCVAGLGDLLALFRCISCRFAFGTDVKKVSQLGAPGRVFTSSEPELTCNVQKYSKTAYLRKAEAEQCQVQSTLLLPVFLSAARHGCVGVLEVVQTSEDMHFMEVADLIASVLEKCQLFTCPRASIERQLPRATTTATLLLPASVDILHAPRQAGSEDSGDRANSTDGVPMADEGVLEQAARVGSAGGVASGSEEVAARGGGGAAGAGAGAAAAAARGGGGGAAGGAGSEDEEDDDGDFGGDSGDDGDEEMLTAQRSARGDGKGGPGGGPSRRRGKGSGNPGKPGVRLSLEELQSQFGVGLKEAAARLGICPTTLKRACRRHGIQRWPRRQLMKVNQALDQMEAQAPLAQLAAQQAQQQKALHHQMGALGGLPGADTRWTTLAQFIPAFHQTLQYNDHAISFGGGQATLGMAGVPQASGANALSLGAAGSWPGNGLLASAAGGRLGGGGFAAPPLLPQFAKLQTNSNLPRGGFQPLGGALLGGGGGKLEPPGLPPGVLPVPQAGGGFPAFPSPSGEGPALSGLSSFGQPPPSADVAAAAQQRMSAFRPGPGTRDGSALATLQGLAAAGAGGGQAGIANGGGGVTSSWQLPQLPSAMITSSLDFDLARAGALAEEQMREDDVGFLDSSVLEMMLQEDAARAGSAGQGQGQGQSNGDAGALRGTAVSGAFGSLKFQ